MAGGVWGVPVVCGAGVDGCCEEEKMASAGLSWALGVGKALGASGSVVGASVSEKGWGAAAAKLEGEDVC